MDHSDTVWTTSAAAFPFFYEQQLVRHYGHGAATPDFSLAGAVRFACSGGGCVETTPSHGGWKFNGSAAVTLEVTCHTRSGNDVAAINDSVDALQHCLLRQ